MQRLLGVAALAVTTLVTTPAAADSRPPAWIVYQSNLRGGGVGAEGLFLVREGGAEDHEILTDYPGAHLHPDWLPDGRRLAFAVDADGRPREIHVADVRTGRARPLLFCRGECETVDDPAFSPDGRRVAYEEVLGPDVDLGGNPFPRKFELRVATLGTTGVRRTRLVTATCAPAEIDQPRWSPDGRWLVFWEGRYADDGSLAATAVFLVRADGSGLRRLTPWSVDAGEADWSPDGRRLVFDTHPLVLFNDEAVVSNLWSIRPDGTGLRQLTHASTPDVRSTQPRFTDDGRIVFTRVTDGGRAIWTVRADGAHGERAVPGGRAVRTHPEVQPGRNHLAVR